MSGKRNRTMLISDDVMTMMKIEATRQRITMGDLVEGMAKIFLEMDEDEKKCFMKNVPEKQKKTLRMKILKIIKDNKEISFGLIENKCRGYTQEEIKEEIEDFISKEVIDKKERQGKRGRISTVYFLKKL